MAITRDDTATLAAIKICIGKTVAGISRIQYYFNDVEDREGFGDLEFVFTDQTFLKLSGFGDGESITAANMKAEIENSFTLTDNNICSWKKHELTEDPEWKNIVGQKMKTAEVQWNEHEDYEERVAACILQFDNDFISFYETGWDSNKFFVNKKLPVTDRETRIENLG